MNGTTIFVGDNNSLLAKQAKSYDKNSYLIDHKNYKEFLKSTKSVTVYTSPGDLPSIDNNRKVTYDKVSNVLYNILEKADKIYYIQNWSKEKLHLKDFSLDNERITLEYLLQFINYKNKNVYGLDKITNSYLNLVDERKNKSPVLYVAGCSISNGDGVEPENEYGRIIANHLNRSLIKLTKSGSSIEWAADQILRSNFKSKDILIWGLTCEFRSPTWNKLKNEATPEKSIDVLYSETRVYKAITSINQVINFCRINDITLLLLPLISTEFLNRLIFDYPEFQPTTYYIADIGNDNKHPGPKQHKIWSEIAIEYLTKNKTYYE